MVWDMVGPTAHLPEKAVGAQPVAAAQSEKPVEPTASITSDKSTPAASSTKSKKTDGKQTGNEVAKLDDKSTDGASPADVQPTSLPGMLSDQTPQYDAGQPHATQPGAALPDTATYVQALPANANAAESLPPVADLVPVPNNIYNLGNAQWAQGNSIVQRLPPVYESAPLPSGRYAAEYPQSPIPIYPSTGKE